MPPPKRKEGAEETKKLIVLTTMLAAAVPAFASHRGATGGDVHIRVTDRSQGASVRQTQRGDARRGASAVEIKQKRVNAFRHGRWRRHHPPALGRTGTDLKRAGDPLRVSGPGSWYEKPSSGHRSRSRRAAR